uniref:Uncharacterized protein n=1 Tax=Salix viminalis TaxID=40686 RepID=A0A6N2M5S3_SALVM
MGMGLGNPASSISSSHCVLIPKCSNETLKSQRLLFNHTHNFRFHHKTLATTFTPCRLHASRKESAAISMMSTIDYDDEDDAIQKMKKWLEKKPRGLATETFMILVLKTGCLKKLSRTDFLRLLTIKISKIRILLYPTRLTSKLRKANTGYLRRQYTGTEETY